MHADSAEAAISRFTTCVLQSGIELPYKAVKSNIADSLNVLIHLERRPGKRYVSHVLELHTYDPDIDRYNLKTMYDQRSEVCLPRIP